jgi:phage shock protein E
MKLKSLLCLLVLTATSQFTTADTIWLDVRSTLEYKMGHLEGAIHLPHSDVSEQANTLLPNKDDEILVYCRSGGRAGKALTKLKAMGYNNVKNIGGLEDAEKFTAGKMDIQ